MVWLCTVGQGLSPSATDWGTALCFDGSDLPVTSTPACRARQRAASPARSRDRRGPGRHARGSEHLRRWTWTEMEDGVFWVSERVLDDVAAEGSGPELASGIRRHQAGTCSSRSTPRRDVARRGGGDASPRDAWPGADLGGCPARHGGTEILTIARAPASGVARWLYFALACVGIFTLFVARSSACVARESGDAALLLALGGVLRGARVLVQRPSRSARLGVLLGRRGRPAAAAAALRALRARVPGAAGSLGQKRRTRTAPLLYLPAVLLGAANIAASCAARQPRRRVLEHGAASSSSGELLYLALSLVGGLVIMTRALHRVRSVSSAAAAVDRVGHGTRRGAVRVRLRAAVRARIRAAGASSCAPSCSASCRSPLRRPSYAIG